MVSEAGASTVSSYRLNPNATARTISASLPVGQGAALGGRDRRLTQVPGVANLGTGLAGLAAR